MRKTPVLVGAIDAQRYRLPQGGKSDVTLSASGTLVRKAYNDNGDPVGKYLREVGFYARYGASELIPDLVESLPDERSIVITRAPGTRCSDLRPDRDSRVRLSADYAEKVVDLVSIRLDLAPQKPLPTGTAFCPSPSRSNALPGFAALASKPDRLLGTVKQRFYDGVGAGAYRDRVAAVMGDYPTRTRQAKEVVRRLGVSASRITITDEVLIKLDWNASNVFVDGGVVSQFIDFEQAFVGTREMLTGILLHNPFWCARTVFTVLGRRGMFRGSTADVVPYLDFALAAVIADAFERDRRPWSERRLEAAYRRHVVDRAAELSTG